MTRRTLAALLCASLTLAAATPLYDVKADPFQDLKKATGQARVEKKHILVEVGGEWCGWCHRMHAFFEQNAPVKKMLEDNFVVLRVNFSEENKNERFLAQYPAIEGYPHLFVLDASGKLLRSQETGALEEGKGYHPGRFTAFLREWSPKR